jgi:hypothetical protein
MPGSGLPARATSLSRFGVRAGTTQQEPAFSARHGAGNQLANEYDAPALCEASHSPAMEKITINFGSPFGSLTIISRIAGMSLAC